MVSAEALRPEPTEGFAGVWRRGIPDHFPQAVNVRWKRTTRLPTPGETGCVPWRGKPSISTNSGDARSAQGSTE